MHGAQALIAGRAMMEINRQENTQGDLAEWASGESDSAGSLHRGARQQDQGWRRTAWCLRRQQRHKSVGKTRLPTFN